MRDCKKGFISISVVYTFLILFVFLMLAILASYISRENLLSRLVSQSKDIIYNGTADDNLDNNIIVKVYIDGVYAKLFPSKTYYEYSPESSYCTSAAILTFDDENWSASLSNISGRTTCMIYFLSKDTNTSPTSSGEEG